MRTAETMQRSAPSESRTSTNRRNQTLSVARSTVSVGSGRREKRGGSPAESRETAESPW